MNDRRTTPPFLLARTTLWSLLLLTVGSGGASSRQADARTDGEPAAATVVALDQAILVLGDPSADYRTVLRNTLAALPLDLRGTASSDIRTFLTRAPTPGPDFECGVDFIRLRAQKELLRIRAAAVSGSAGPLEPQTCYAAPYVVDLSLPSSGPRVVEIYGYDFDRVPLELFLVNSDDHQDVTPSLVRRSHYHLSVILGEGGVRLSPTSRALGLTWGNLIHHSIPVIGPTTSVCTPRIDLVPSGQTLFHAQSMSDVGPTERIKVLASTVLDYSSNEIDAVACLTAADRKSGRTVASGCETAFLVTLDPDRVVDAVLGETRARVSYVHGDRPVETRNGSGGGLVRDWAFAGFGGERTPARLESEATAEVRMTVRFNRLRVVSTENDGCVSPISYAEARRTRSLGPETMRALDPQLTGLPREIRALRPRFAPPA